ncbi:MAG: helix-turn-helix transcriptional regulator [Chloroflexi bacterium]|nr:helix-turn-helix transcriptional regulator [Chloroflexota bacterium]
MDQIKTGKFISVLRKEKELTQMQLAHILGVSDKTISKWERGAGLPEVSLMLPLCEVLEINVNELLTGEKLTDSEYKKKAEANIMDLVKENRENKKRMFQSIVLGTITIIAVCALVAIAAFIEIPAIARILIIVFAVLTAVLGIGTTVTLDINAGYFECPNCKALFIPTMKAYVKSYHTITKRRLTCPECGETSMCKRRVVR